MRNFRVEVGGEFASYDINGVTGFDNRRQLAWQSASLDLRYQLLERETAPFGMLFGVGTHAARRDETTAAPVRQYGTDFTLAFDRELIPNSLVVALNLLYQPEWTHVLGTGVDEQDATIGAATALMAQVRPGFFLGGEARYLRKYEDLGLNQLSGQALFVGPTAFIKLTERSRLTAAWSFQAWGARPAEQARSISSISNDTRRGWCSASIFDSFPLTRFFLAVIARRYCAARTGAGAGST